MIAGRRLRLEEIIIEGELSLSDMRSIFGGAAPRKPAVKSAPKPPSKAAPRTATPALKKTNAHVHATDGIHDNNNRPGNNGLGAPARAPKPLKAGAGATVRRNSEFFFKRCDGRLGVGADLDVMIVKGSVQTGWDPIALDLDGDGKLAAQTYRAAPEKVFDWEKSGYDWIRFNSAAVDWNAVNRVWAARFDRIGKQASEAADLRDLGLTGFASAAGSQSNLSYYSFGRNLGDSRYAWDEKGVMMRSVSAAGFDGARDITNAWAARGTHVSSRSGFSDLRNSFSAGSDRRFTWVMSESATSFKEDAAKQPWWAAQFGRSWGRWQAKSTSRTLIADNADVSLFTTGGRLFDLDADGVVERMTWIGGRDTFVAVDWNENGRIDSGIELLGARTNDGVRELKFLDSNFDGNVDGQDKDWSKMRLLRADGSMTTLSAGAISEFHVGDSAPGALPESRPEPAKSRIACGEGARAWEASGFWFQREDGSRGAGISVELDMVAGRRQSERSADLLNWWRTDEARSWKTTIAPVALDIDHDDAISTAAFRRRAGNAGRLGGGRDAEWNFEGGMPGFDMNFDHLVDRTTWIAGADAFLAIDWNRNSRIDSGAELFGPRTGDGLRELRELDGNLDGILNDQDGNFGLLRIVSAEKDRRWFWHAPTRTWTMQEVSSENRFRTESLAAKKIVSFDIGIDAARAAKRLPVAAAADTAGLVFKSQAPFGSDGRIEPAAAAAVRKT